MNQYIYKYILLIACLVISVKADAQNMPLPGTQPVAVPVAPPAAYLKASNNFIRTWEPSLPTTDTAVVTAINRTTAEVKQTTQYFDDFGTPLQMVLKGISAAGQDLVMPVVNDSFGREQ